MRTTRRKKQPRKYGGNVRHGGVVATRAQSELTSRARGSARARVQRETTCRNLRILCMASRRRQYAPGRIAPLVAPLSSSPLPSPPLSPLELFVLRPERTSFGSRETFSAPGREELTARKLGRIFPSPTPPDHRPAVGSPPRRSRWKSSARSSLLRISRVDGKSPAGPQISARGGRREAGLSQ